MDSKVRRFLLRRGQVLFTILGYPVTLGTLLLFIALLSQVIVTVLAAQILQKEVEFLRRLQALPGA